MNALKLLALCSPSVPGAERKLLRFLIRVSGAATLRIVHQLICSGWKLISKLN